MDADKRIQATMEKMRSGGGKLWERLPDWFPGISQDEILYIISTLREEMLINDDDNPGVFRLGAKGRNVVDSNLGWEGYKKRKEEEIDLELKIKQSVVSTNVVTRVSLILTAFFTFFTLLITFLDYSNNKSSLKAQNELLKIEWFRDSIETHQRVIVDTTNSQSAGDSIH